jgi:hypothetical protein
MLLVALLVMTPPLALLRLIGRLLARSLKPGPLFALEMFAAYLAGWRMRRSGEAITGRLW